MLAWDDTPAEKQRVWNPVKERAPTGRRYAPRLLLAGGPQDPAFGVLKLEPWRIKLWSLQEMATGKPSQVWRP